MALIHGGPGAAGSLKELAKLLAKDFGVLEPIQIADSITGQIEELKQFLVQYADWPIIMIGHSWGAMLAYLFAAQYPKFITKLIMVSSGPFATKYVPDIMSTRLSRLKQGQKLIFDDLAAKLNNEEGDVDFMFHRLGKLLARIDAYDPISIEGKEIIKGQYHIYKTIWPEVVKIREMGGLLKAGQSIQCQVIAFHGDFDPHPYQGVKEPLSAMLKDFTFILLKQCGHEPWIERLAREHFLHLLRSEIERVYNQRLAKYNLM